MFWSGWGFRTGGNKRHGGSIDHSGSTGIFDGYRRSIDNIVTAEWIAHHRPKVNGTSGRYGRKDTASGIGTRVKLDGIDINDCRSR